MVEKPIEIAPDTASEETWNSLRWPSTCVVNRSILSETTGTTAMRARLPATSPATSWISGAWGNWPLP